MNALLQRISRLKTSTRLQSLELFPRNPKVMDVKSSCCKYDGHEIHTTPLYKTFWEKNKKGGYRTELPMPSKTQIIFEGFRDLKYELRLWKNEIKDKLASDPILVYRPGEVDVVFSFKTREMINNWVVTMDSNHNNGKSTATLEISDTGAGLFEGVVHSDYIRDGRIKRSGYANMRTLRARKSFKRETTYDWTQYNTLVLKVRGDGRNYLINLHTEGYFDLMWNDIYHYVLFTRGGPHWQIAKIPFSKFFLSSKGRVQDKQGPIRLDRVSHFGFSVGAKNGLDGPFSLEIDFVGLEFDPSQSEEFAYEMYRTESYTVAT